MITPSDRKYAKTDEWVKVEENVARIGISDFAQSQLSDLVYFGSKIDQDQMVKKGEVIAELESVKSANEIYAPVSGKVIAINQTISNTPEVLNSDPYEQGWMFKIEISEPAELDDLMDSEAYQSYCTTRSH
jgi:glycine cleavage system H protein